MSEVATKSNWNFRLAVPADAPAFAKWAAENQQIDEKDLFSAMKKNNPTTLFFVVEKDGVPILFAPFYCQLALAYLGINPESSGRDRLQSLDVMLDGAMAFAVSMGIREITTLTREDYGVAKWAAAHGFEKQDRAEFKCDINKIIADEVAATSAKG